MKKLGGNIRHIMEQQYKDYAGDTDPDTVVDPFLMSQRQGGNTDPVADLTAEICGQNRENGNDSGIAVIQGQKQNQRQVNDKRINLLSKGKPVQEKGNEKKASGQAGKGQQGQVILPVQLDAEKCGRGIDPEQQGCRIVYKT